MGIYFPNGRSTLWIHLGRIYRESSSFPTRVGWDGQPRMCSPQRSSFFSTSGREIIAESIGKTTGHSWGDHGEIMGRSWALIFFLNWLIYRSCFFSLRKKYLMVDEHFLHWTGNEHAPLLDKATALREPCLGKPYLVGGLEHFLFFHISGF